MTYLKIQEKHFIALMAQVDAISHGWVNGSLVNFYEVWCFSTTFYVSQYRSVDWSVFSARDKYKVHSVHLNSNTVQVLPRAWGWPFS